MKLNYRVYGDGTPLLVLHGVFGSSDNWQTLGKDFAGKYRTYLIDLRNHGLSPHSDEFNYEVMAADLVELMKDENLDSAYVLGHSMGGKVAMHLATHYPDLVRKLIVVDIAPKHYPPHHQQIFEGFRAVKLDEIKSRKEADEQMKAVISHPGIRQFILKNLDRTKEGAFQWKLNLDAIESAIGQVGEGLRENAAFSGDTLFIAGSQSDYITKEDHPSIKNHFPKASIETVAGAGHWVHAEKPKELNDLVLTFLEP